MRVRSNAPPTIHGPRAAAFSQIRRRAPAARLSRVLLSGTALICGVADAAAAGLGGSGAEPSGVLLGSALGIGGLAAAVVIAITCSLWLGRISRNEKAALRSAAHARADAYALKSLLAGDALGTVLWVVGDPLPHLLGAAAMLDHQIPATGKPLQDAVKLDLAPWLGAPAAAALAAPLEALRAQGRAFSLPITGPDGAQWIAEGRATDGSRMLSVRTAPASGSLAEGGQMADPGQGARAQVERAQAETAARGILATVFAAAPFPMWLRDTAGALMRANPAFAQAVGAPSPEEAVARGMELLDLSAREAAAATRRDGKPYQTRARLVAGGRRRVLEVLEVDDPAGAGGLAIDITEAEAARAEVAHTIAAHRRTLDQLATAVVMFGADERLAFHNSAYEGLFGLDAAFLDTRPTESEILETLRTARKVPEQADFRAWREHLREAYRALEPIHDWWHLPGGQMLRVVVTPNAEGGITYLFEDVSEHMALESRYNSLIRIQGETLDELAEAVAVFGSDGKLRLHNHAFLSLWSLSAQALSDKPHIDAVAAMCRPLHADLDSWARIRAVVTALEHRSGTHLRMERADGLVLDGAAQPLPDGGTLVTFRDVTDSVKVERALIERNEALEAADALKNAFVGHVSYHLRTPLNTLIGYAHMLGEPNVGPLNGKQLEFLDHVRQSSDALRALIDDILDLASIDAGAMALDLGEVDVRATLEAVGEAVRDLLAERQVSLHIDAPQEIGAFTADRRRVRQILFNLLSNAIAVSPPQGVVTLSARRTEGALSVEVRDQGPGISGDIAGKVFERFETHGAGAERGGVGLGLSLVRSFMELHGGSITLGTAEGGGALAVCRFPLAAARRDEAAE
ncbi:PAS domain-containing sensor histidine kinase [Roseixanthobacter glucoisosaccharinicivorans]|uniref:PAS domain-containing sensor histidine kinase n=1 Tax=Roseixanthobacter glucoisosaccharinicivorans TaxID=3119923 RepID=UPI00372A39AE